MVRSIYIYVFVFSNDNFLGLNIKKRSKVTKKPKNKSTNKTAYAMLLKVRRKQTCRMSLCKYEPHKMGSNLPKKKKSQNNAVLNKN